MLKFNWYYYSELKTDQLYEILALRCAVFVVEQNCPYLDIDSEDQRALHLLGTTDGLLAAYLRLFVPTKPNDKIVFGRVVLPQFARARGNAKRLMQTALDYCSQHYPNHTITCSAQVYLQAFYESFGLSTVGEPYLLDNILHVDMELL